MHGHVLFYFRVYTEYYPLVSWTCFGSQISSARMLNARRCSRTSLALMLSRLLLAALAASASSAADAGSVLRPLGFTSRRDMASCWGRSSVECSSPRPCDGNPVSMAEADALAPILSHRDSMGRSARPSAHPPRGCSSGALSEYHAHHGDSASLPDVSWNVSLDTITFPSFTSQQIDAEVYWR